MPSQAPVSGPFPLHPPKSLSDAEQRCLSDGITLIHSGAFFEAHEIIESAWTDCRDENRRFLQAIIHIAVGCHHESQGNRTGMLRQFRKAIIKLSEYPVRHAGLDLAVLRQQLETAIRCDPKEAWDPHGIRIPRSDSEDAAS